MGIWLTLCWICDTLAHVSQCDWRGSLGKVYLPFYDHISHFLSQFLTEFSIVSLLSPALAATLLPMAPDCMSWHHTESEERGGSCSLLISEQYYHAFVLCLLTLNLVDIPPAAAHRPLLLLPYLVEHPGGRLDWNVNTFVICWDVK